MPENCKRMARCHQQHVESQIELETVEQVRIWNVTLHNIALMNHVLCSVIGVQLERFSRLVKVVDEEDALALA